MGRRWEHTRDQFTDMAVKAGQQILLEQGVTGFSARKVAKAIGYSIGSIYHVFKSHEQLMLHIHGATLDDMHTFVSERTSAITSGTDRLMALADAYIAFSEQNTNRWVALFQFHLPQDEQAPGWYTQKINALFGLLEDALLPLTNNNPKETKQSAKILWASIHGICQLGLSGKLDTVAADSAKTLTHSLIQHYARGLSCQINPTS